MFNAASGEPRDPRAVKHQFGKGTIDCGEVSLTRQSSSTGVL